MKIGIREILAILVTFSLVTIFVYASDTASTDVQEGPTMIRNNTADAPDTFTAEGGNITVYNVSHKMQSQKWATFFGFVRGQWVLDAGSLGSNSTNFHIFNWTTLDSNLEGLIFFTNGTVNDWTSVMEATNSDCDEEDKFLGASPSPDNVSETYMDEAATTWHEELSFSGITITEDTAPSVNTSSNGGNEWQSALLEDSDGDTRIYTAVVDRGNQNYAGDTADFQIMVPVSSATHTRTYYVYAALE